MRNSFAIKKWIGRKENLYLVVSVNNCTSLDPVSFGARISTNHPWIYRVDEREGEGEMQSPPFLFYSPPASSKYFPRNGTFLFARFTISARRRRRRCFRTATFLNVQFFFPPTRNDRWKVYSPLFSFPLYLLSKKERERSNKYSLPLYIKSIWHSNLI